MKFSTLFLFFQFLLINISAQEKPAEKNPLPETVRKHWELMSQGEWIANNPYQTNPPIDAYGMSWQIAPGGMAFVGELFTIRNNKKVKILWTFLQYWDPGQQKIVSVQYGENPDLGNLAIGAHSPSPSQFNNESEVSIYNSSGALIGRAGHKNVIAQDTLYSNSFNIINGEWQKRGVFIWEKKPKKYSLD